MLSQARGVHSRAVNHPLRGNKGSVWEGGHPCAHHRLAACKIPAATATDAIAGMFDILPTFAVLAGSKMPADRKIDRANLWPVLSGETVTMPPHDPFFTIAVSNLKPLAKAIENLILTVPAVLVLAVLVLAVLPAKIPLSIVPEDKPRLFNLKTDLGEVNDLALHTLKWPPSFLPSPPA